MNKELTRKYLEETKAYESPELDMCRTQLAIEALTKDQDFLRSLRKTLGLYFLMIDLRVDDAIARLRKHRN